LQSELNTMRKSALCHCQNWAICGPDEAGIYSMLL